MVVLDNAKKQTSHLTYSFSTYCMEAHHDSTLSDLICPLSAATAHTAVMADVRAQLSSELTRILDCPYPASLTKVAGLLACADVLTIQGCIHDQSPCAVAKLATLVCEALPLWTYSLDILKSLCHSSEFRDTLLLQSPSLLDTLLTKANSSHQDFEEIRLLIYSQLCVLLLSRPLPDSLPLPASTQSFFLQAFEEAILAPDVCTLKPIYCMLNGACRGLVSLLPSDARHKFDKELCQILSSNGTGQNSMLLLWCFGIVLLVEHPFEVGQRRGSEQSCGHTAQPTGTERQWKTASGRKLFGSAEGMYKTVTLTYLSVIWATKGDVGVSDIEAIGGIRIATRTLAFVDQQVRQAWPKSSSLAKNTFPKLPSKILRTGINLGVQLEALTFFAMIAGKGNLPCEIVTQYETSIGQAANFADNDYLGETLSTSLPLFAPQIQETATRAFLFRLLEACISAPSFHQVSGLQILAEELQFGSTKCAPLREKILQGLLSHELQQILQNFAQTTSTDHKDQGLNSHHMFSSMRQRKLISTFISMLLTVIMSAQGTGPRPPLSLVVTLIDKQQQLACPTNICPPQEVFSTRPSISLFQQRCTPFTGQHLQDWRHRLGSELESQSFYQRDSLLRSVAQICEELEARCNTVEEPLRREQDRSLKLAQRVAELSEQVSLLESQAADDRFHLDGLEDEKLGIAEEKDRLSACLEKLEIEFADANKKADAAMHSIQEEFKAKESRLQSTVLAYDEDIRVRDERIGNLEHNLSEIHDELDQKDAELKTISEKYVGLQGKLSDIEKTVCDERAVIAQQIKEINRLEVKESSLRDQLYNAEHELETLTRQLSDLQVSRQELLESSEEALREAKTKHGLEMDSAVTNAAKQYNEVYSELQEALRNGQETKHAYEETCQDLQLAHASVTKLEEKIQELTETCSEQGDELDELRALRRNVLASMGLANNETRNPRPRRDHRCRKSAIQIQDNGSTTAPHSEGFTNTAMEKVANASFTSTDSATSGPAPKRQKPQFAMKAKMQNPYSQRPTLSSCSFSKKLSSTKRSALKPVSPNRRRTTGGFGLSQSIEEQPLKQSLPVRGRRVSLRGNEPADFNMDEFLAGTPSTPRCYSTGEEKVHSDDATA